VATLADHMLDGFRMREGGGVETLMAGDTLQSAVDR